MPKLFHHIRLRFVTSALLVSVPLGLTSVYAQDESVFDDGLESGSATESATEGSPEGTGEGAAGGTEGESPADREAAMQQRMAAAQSAMQRKDWAAAIASFNEVLSINPTLAPALLGQGECFRELGANDLAVRAVMRATTQPSAAQFPGLLERAHFVLGDIYLKMGNYRDADKEFTAAIQLNPMNPESYWSKAKATMREVVTSAGGIDQAAQGRLMEAVGTLQRAIQIKPDFGEAYLERGRILFRVGQMDFAIADHQKALELMGPNSEAAADYGIAIARRAAQKAEKDETPPGEVVTDYRTALESLDNFLKDANYGQKSPPWEPRDPLHMTPESVLLTRGETRIALGNELEGAEATAQYEAAIQDMDKLLGYSLEEIEESRAHFTRGQALRMVNRFDDAIAAFTRSIDGFPAMYGTYTEGHLRRGICYFHQNRFTQALQDFQMASVYAGNPFGYEPRAMYWAGLTHAKLGQYNLAIRSYTRAVANAPNYAPAYLNRGLAYLNTGRNDQAAQDFDAVLRLDPTHPHVRQYRELAEQDR